MTGITARNIGVFLATMFLSSLLVFYCYRKRQFNGDPKNKHSVSHKSSPQKSRNGDKVELNVQQSGGTTGVNDSHRPLVLADELANKKGIYDTEEHSNSELPT